MCVDTGYWLYGQQNLHLSKCIKEAIIYIADTHCHSHVTYTLKDAVHTTQNHWLVVEGLHSWLRPSMPPYPVRLPWRTEAHCLSLRELPLASRLPACSRLTGTRCPSVVLRSVLTGSAAWLTDFVGQRSVYFKKDYILPS